jgi:hypothetical protein
MCPGSGSIVALGWMTTTAYHHAVYGNFRCQLRNGDPALADSRLWKPVQVLASLYKLSMDELRSRCEKVRKPRGSWKSMRPTRAYTAYWSGLDYTRTCRSFSHEWAGSLLCLEKMD